MKHMLLLFLGLPLACISQVTGVVEDGQTKEPVFGAKIMASTGEKVLSDIDGSYTISPASYPATLVIVAQTFVNDTIVVEGPGELNIKMNPPLIDLKTVVVSAGRRDQDIEDISISMEIIRPELFDNKGLANLEEAIDQSPGVYAMDGQVSIRGGSGFAYGAGSRVLLLWNGMPLLSGDAGDTKWNAVPLESASQIEIMKGASSVLYGSGALNGLISISEREPTLKGETRFKVQSGIYGNPRRESLKWWSQSPMFYQVEAFNSKMYKNVGYTISGNGFLSDGYREGETEIRGRVSGTFYIRPEKYKNLKAGIGFNVQRQKTGNFIIWESDSLGYTPNGTADTSNIASTLTYNGGTRMSIDPYIKIYDKNKNLHTVKTRFYRIANDNISNPSQSSTAHTLYGDYNFQKKWKNGSAVTSGATYLRSDVFSALFGDHNSTNLAAYGQYEHHMARWDLTGGIRVEYFEQDGRAGDSDFYIGKDSSLVLPVYPIIRLGAHYQLAEFTHLRASFGQGIRYPSVAERYTQTSVGALNVFPNPNLRPEVGWAAEIGFKQGVKIGKNWKGLVDISAFMNQYDNMMEFTFGSFKPDTIAWSLNPEDPGYINKWFGFQAQNAEKARITGIELSFNSQGKIGDVELTSLIGYTYMNPISLNQDSAYLSTFSDTTTNILKYRFNHLAKADVEATWKGISIGVSARYNSYMNNIDAIFEGEIVDGLSILPGLKEYREENNRGSFVVDFRTGYSFAEHYRVGFIINNLLNAEYVTRPGDIQAPRSFIVQLQMKF
ncbi:MAG: TonB-dependent receptor [Crocinitomicaceae bacterium]|nr:TonB-dependent receptor [Crocinitomicaceae bacterium]